MTLDSLKDGLAAATLDTGDRISAATARRLACEAGIYDAKFDKSGTRLVTCEADKTIKIWKEDPDANAESDPVDMPRWTRECRQLKRY